MPAGPYSVAATARWTVPVVLPLRTRKPLITVAIPSAPASPAAGLHHPLLSLAILLALLQEVRPCSLRFMRAASGQPAGDDAATKERRADRAQRRARLPARPSRTSRRDRSAWAPALTPPSITSSPFGGPLIGPRCLHTLSGRRGWSPSPVPPPGSPEFSRPDRRGRGQTEIALRLAGRLRRESLAPPSTSAVRARREGGGRAQG